MNMMRVKNIPSGEKCSPKSQKSIILQPADCHICSSWH